MAFLDWDLLTQRVKFRKSFSIFLWGSLSFSWKAPFAQRGGSVSGGVEALSRQRKAIKGV